MTELWVGLGVPAFVAAVMAFFLYLTGRDTAAARRPGGVPVQHSGARRGLVFHDPADRRTWVPRPQGNGWDPNAATPGGKAVLAFLLLLPLAVVATVVLAVYR